MTNIVERLRDLSAHLDQQTNLEAADEIERLRHHAQRAPTRKQIETVIDDYLGNIDVTYEDSRRRCAQRIVDLYAVTSTPDEPAQGRQESEACPYAIDGCVLENQEIGPCLCALTSTDGGGK